MSTPETVRVYAEDELGNPLVGVLVRAYDGASLVTQNVTALVGSEAYAEITLDGDTPPIDYTIRLSKNGVAFDGLFGDESKTPQGVSVYSPATGSPTGTNYFSVVGQTFTRPSALDPRMCRASGFIKDVAGRPLANLSIRFMNISYPLIVDGYGVLGGNQWGQTDADGYFELDLYRNAQLRVQVEGFEDYVREVTVPDAASCNLVGLLFPVVASVTYGTVPATTTSGSYVDVDVVITDSVGVELDPSEHDVIFLSDDINVAVASISDGKLRVNGVAAGTTTITAIRSDTTIVIVPEPVLDSLAVVVS
jgi:hypothetical protein